MLHVAVQANPDVSRPPAEIEDAVRRRSDIRLSVASVTVVVPRTLERTSSGR